MNKVSENWPIVKFGDVVKLNTERSANPVADGIERYVGLEHIEPEDLRIRRWGLVEEGTTFTNRFRPRQVLFGKRRAYQRKVAVADFEGVCSGDIYVFEPKNNRLLPELLPFLCQTEAFFEHAVGTSAGSLSPRTNWTQLANFEFALPPLEEQRQFCQLLESHRVANNRFFDAYNAAKQSRLAMSLRLFRDDSIITQELNSLIECTRYGPRFSGALYDEAGQVAQIRTTDFDEDGNINYATIPRARLDPSQYQEHILRDGDIVISRSGTCGLTTVFQVQEIPTVAAAFLILLRVKKTVLLPEYLHEYFSSPFGRQLTASLARGGVQKNINGTELLAQQVPCPSLDRQSEVIKLLKLARDAEHAITNRRKYLQGLQKTFLAKLSGKAG